MASWLPVAYCVVLISPINTVHSSTLIELVLSAKDCGELWRWLESTYLFVVFVGGSLLARQSRTVKQMFDCSEGWLALCVRESHGVTFNYTSMQKEVTWFILLANLSNQNYTCQEIVAL